MVKAVQAYEADDGTHHSTLNEAVAHEICGYLDDMSDGGLISTRLLAAKLTEHGHRMKLTKLLEQLQ